MDKYIDFNNKTYKLEFSNHHAGNRKFLVKLIIFELEQHIINNDNTISDVWSIYGTPYFFAYFGPTVATRKKCDYYINVLESKINDEIFKKILSMINFNKCKGGQWYNITNILIDVLDTGKGVPMYA